MGKAERDICWWTAMDILLGCMVRTIMPSSLHSASIVYESPSYIVVIVASVFSWYFGVSLSASLNHSVPIGLIASTVGGTRIEAWTSKKSLEQCGPVVPMVEQSAYSPAHHLNAPINLNNASLLYNAMIAPLSPTRLTAVLWFQGQ
jgi:hypothetical protein